MGTFKAQLLIKQPEAVRGLHPPVLGAVLSPLSPGLEGDGVTCHLLFSSTPCSGLSDWLRW